MYKGSKRINEITFIQLKAKKKLELLDLVGLAGFVVVKEVPAGRTAFPKFS